MNKPAEEPWTVSAAVAVHSEGSGLSMETVSITDIDEAIKNEILLIKDDESYMGLWEIAVGADVLSTSIQSVYPELGWQSFTDLNNRIIRPCQDSNCPLCRIMWTSTRQDMNPRHWMPNHVVPLMLLTLSADVTVEGAWKLNEAFIEDQAALVNELFRVKWNNEGYIAKVTGVDPETQHVHLMYMEERQGLLFWPPQDHSWESTSVLLEPVSLQLDETRSNQWLQYFSCLKLGLQSSSWNECVRACVPMFWPLVNVWLE